MPPVLTGQLRHDEVLQRSMQNLENARQKAQQTRGYDSQEARRIMSEGLQARSPNNIVPHDWQLNISESFTLGLDCIGIAPTGSGKTIPMVLPLFLPENRRKTVVIVSPLKSLEYDQVSHCSMLSLI